MSKKIRDETIIDALLISATVRSAAAKLEINEQTIYKSFFALGEYIRQIRPL